MFQYQQPPALPAPPQHQPQLQQDVHGHGIDQPALILQNLSLQVPGTVWLAGPGANFDLTSYRSQYALVLFLDFKFLSLANRPLHLENAVLVAPDLIHETSLCSVVLTFATDNMHVLFCEGLSHQGGATPVQQ